MIAGNRLGLVLVAAIVIGAVPTFSGAVERVVLGEYYTQLG